MEKQEARQIFEAIKKDDVNAFITFVVQKNLQNLSFGRFPLLSVCYLFGSSKIIDRFEKHLSRTSKFEKTFEFFEIYLRFKKCAKKSLRLYLDDDKFCHPIEMLAILDKREKIAKLYNLFFKNEEILTNLTKIYNLNYKTQIEAGADSFVCESKKLTSMQRFWLAVTCSVVVLFSLFSLVSVLAISNKFGVGTSKLPILVDSEQELVLALQKGDKFYKLQTDLTLESFERVQSFNGTLDGNNHTLEIKNLNQSILEELSGTIKNLNLKIKKTPEKISQNYSIISEKSTGNLEKVSVFANFDAKTEVKTDTYISAFVIHNEGLIKDSTLQVSANIENANPTNCYFSGFAGINDGNIENCKATGGELKTNTVDIAVCAVTNNKSIEGFENNVAVYQISGEEWNPNCSGVVINNLAVVNNAKNNAKIEAMSVAEKEVEDAEGNLHMVEVFVSGIACQNAGNITKCKNFGELASTGNLSTVYAGGIVSLNTFQEIDSKLVLGEVVGSKSVSNIKAVGEKSKCIVGGIVAYNLAAVTECGAEVLITVSKDCYAGGLIGRNGAIYTQYGVIAYAGHLTKSYSNSQFATHESGVNQENYILASLIGLVDSSRIVLSGNHYVKNTTFNAVLYLGTIGNPFTDPAACNATAYNSFEDIPIEVKNYVQ